MAGLKWTGLAEYKAAIAAMRKNIEKLEPVVKGIVFGTQRDARMAAPVDTGRLRSSLQGVVIKTDASVVGVVGSNVIYSPFQEHGTRRIKPRRFLGKGFDIWKDRFITAFGEFIKTALKK